MLLFSWPPQKMSKASLYDDPVFTYNELMTKANELEKFAKYVASRRLALPISIPILSV